MRRLRNLSRGSAYDFRSAPDPAMSGGGARVIIAPNFHPPADRTMSGPPELPEVAAQSVSTMRFARRAVTEQFGSTHISGVSGLERSPGKPATADRKAPGVQHAPFRAGKGAIPRTGCASSSIAQSSKSVPRRVPLVPPCITSVADCRDLTLPVGAAAPSLVNITWNVRSTGPSVETASPSRCLAVMTWHGVTRTPVPASSINRASSPPPMATVLLTKATDRVAVARAASSRALWSTRRSCGDCAPAVPVPAAATHRTRKKSRSCRTRDPSGNHVPEYAAAGTGLAGRRGDLSVSWRMTGAPFRRGPALLSVAHRPSAWRPGLRLRHSSGQPAPLDGH